MPRKKAPRPAGKRPETTPPKARAPANSPARQRQLSTHYRARFRSG